MKLKRSFTAFLPCAGLGTRLRPMTEHWPKPLIPVFGVPLFDISFAQIMACGPDSCRINTHYLAKQMTDHTSLRWPNLIKIEHEAGKILGTGGCLGRIKNEIETDDILVYNGDVLCDLDILHCLAVHQESGADVTMVLLPKVLPGENAVFVREHMVTGIGSAMDAPPNSTAHGFTGIHVLSKKMLGRLPESGDYAIIPHYLAALESDLHIHAHVHSGQWFDLGTPQRYFNAHQALLDLWKAGHNILRPVFGQLDDAFEASLQLEGEHIFFVAPKASVSDSAVIKNYTILLDGADVGSSACVQESIILSPTPQACEGQISRRIIGYDWIMSF